MEDVINAFNKLINNDCIDKDKAIDYLQKQLKVIYNDEE